MITVSYDKIIKFSKLQDEYARLIIVLAMAFLLSIFSYYLLSVLASISAEGKIEILPDPNYILYYLTEGIDWELLGENPVLFFTDEKNSVLIYVAIYIIMLSFMIQVFKRAIFLFESYSSRNEIQKALLSKPEVERKEFTYSYENEKKDNLKRFFFEIYQKPRRFKEFYEIALKIEHDSIEEFTRILTNHYTWMIRIGIIGTLLGVMIAFYEISQGIIEHDFGAEKITTYFKSQIYSALTGNAIAVVSSLASHTISLVLEIFLGRFFKSQTNVRWLDDNYREILKSEWFDDSLESNKDRLIFSVNLVIKKLHEIEIKSIHISNSLNKISLQQIKDNTNRIIRKSIALKADLEKIDPKIILKKKDEIQLEIDYFSKQYHQMLTSIFWVEAADLINRIKELLKAFNELEPPPLEKVIELKTKIIALLNSCNKIEIEPIANDVTTIMQNINMIKGKFTELLKVFEDVTNTVREQQKDFENDLSNKSNSINKQLDFLKNKIIAIVNIISKNDELIQKEINN